MSMQLLSAVNCWLKCVMLNPTNQTDHAECKSRPDSGLSAITELDPGYITGKLCFASYQLELIQIIFLLISVFHWCSGMLI